MKHTRNDLYQMQSLPLSAKIQMTRRRIRGWVEEYGLDNVYVSISGGKDSMVLLDIARKDYPDIEAVFVDTGLEYPSVKKKAKQEATTVLKPSMDFRNVIINFGYPIISKEVANNVDGARKYIKILTDRQTDRQTYRIPTTTEGLKELVNTINKDWGKVKGSPQRLAILTGTKGKMKATIIPEDRSAFNMEKYSFLLEAPFKISDKCCDIMKKEPSQTLKKYPILGTMAEESRLRLQKWLQHGCNGFDMKKPKSTPLAFWTEQDIYKYIKENNLKIAETYGNIIVKNKGIEGQINIHDYLNDYREADYETTGENRTGCIFCGFGITQDTDRFVRLSKNEPILCDYVIRGGEFVNGNWQPKDGLGYWFVLSWLNKYGNLNIQIPNEKEYVAKYSTKETDKYLK